MEQKEQSPFPAGVELAILGLIVYSIISMALETMPEMKAYRSHFWISDAIVVGIFTLEYFWRWYCSKDKKAYPLRFMAIVDLLSILPFYISLGVDLRGLRSIRLLRVFRILKLGRYSQALQTIGEAFRRTGPELATFAFIAAVTILLSATALYYAEHEHQPKIYSSIPASLWWAIVTLTTVGYGDVYPSTLVGKCIASLVMLMGIGFIAIPTSLLSSSLTDILRDRREQAQQSKAAASSREEHRPE